MHRAFGELPVGGRTQVVFYVTGALDIFGMRRVALKLRENCDMGFAERPRQHIETASVGHPDHHFPDPRTGGGPQHSFDARDHAFPAIETEALGSGVLYLKIVFEALSLDDVPVDVLFYIIGVIPAVVDAFDVLLDPGSLLDFLHVHVLNADGRAVALPQDLQYFAQRGALLAAERRRRVEIDLPVQIFVGESVMLVVQFLQIAGALKTQGVE